MCRKARFGMSKFIKRILCLLITVFISLVITGCKKDVAEEPIPDFKEVNAIKVNEDLSISLTLVDTFTEDYYRTDELLKMLSDEASAFNGVNGSGSLVAEKVEEKDGYVNVVMRFSGREAYVAYNEAVFFVGTVEAALNSGLRLNQTLIDITDPEKSITGDDLASMKDTYILITNDHLVLQPLTIETFGRISYVTAGLEPWYGRNSVRITAVKDELIYILFK